MFPILKMRKRQLRIICLRTYKKLVPELSGSKSSVFLVFLLTIWAFSHRHQMLMSIAPLFTERPCTGARNSESSKIRTLPLSPQPDLCALLNGSWGSSLLCHCFLERDLKRSVFQLWEIGHLSSSEYSFVQHTIFSQWLLHSAWFRRCRVSASPLGNTDELTIVVACKHSEARPAVLEGQRSLWTT